MKTVQHIHTADAKIIANTVDSYINGAITDAIRSRKIAKQNNLKRIHNG